jgi:hypothetical protein
MLNVALISLFIACGDSEEQQTIPTPPEKPVAAEPAPAEKVEEAPVANEEAEGNNGTKPEVTVSEKLITTGEVKAAQSKMIKGKVEKQLKAKAKKAGFDSIQNIKLVKNECQAGGTCVGIGQATAVKKSISYSTGNAVSVTQEDGSSKNGIIASINGEEYTVRYDDASEGVVGKKDLGLQK